MKVRHGEGVANRAGPEPCTGTREGAGEASVGECIGQPLSRERIRSREPTPLLRRKAIRMGAISQVSRRPGVVLEPGMCRRSLSLVAVATSSLKRRQQVPKPRGSLDIYTTLEPLLSQQQGQHLTRPLLAMERRSGRGLGTGQRHRTDRLGT